MRDLGTLGGSFADAHAINNAGTMVGESLLGHALVPHAFLYDYETMRDPHQFSRMPAGWVLVSAFDINVRRRIRAWACLGKDCIVVRLDPLPVAVKNQSAPRS